MRRREADSSTRSIALSGRNLSDTYRSESTAAATSAESLISTPWCASYRSFSPRRMAMVSDTEGCPTKTGWKRRSSAASFSMCLRYSSSVVAPTARSSPRASIGFSRLAGVDGALRRAGADDRVQLVDEEDDVAGRVLDLREDGLQPLLELAAVLRAGEQRADVERPHALALETLGDVARDDPLREPLDDRGLADAGLADQNGVVLRAAREDLDHAPDLVVAADDRVELAGLRERGEVAAVLLQCLIRALRILRGHAAGRRAPPAAPRAGRRAGRRRAPATGARRTRTRPRARASPRTPCRARASARPTRAAGPRPRRRPSAGCAGAPPPPRAARRSRSRSGRRASAEAPARGARRSGGRESARGCRARRASSCAPATASCDFNVSLLKSSRAPRVPGCCDDGL